MLLLRTCGAQGDGGAAMIDDGPMGCLWLDLPPRAPLKQWLAALTAVALLLAAFYALFSAMGW
jgi:hypothetical protein